MTLRNGQYSCSIAAALMALSLILISLFALGAAAHEIPADVKVNAFVRPTGHKLELLIRAPMAALQEVDYPRRGPGYLEVSRADEALRHAAQLWLIQNIDVYEND